MDFLTQLFDTSDFPRRWDCGSWTPAQGWLHILSDLGVWSAYVAIPIVLGSFVLRRKDIPFRSTFWLFGAFILACGTTHLMEAIIFWWPAYRLAGIIKLFTAIVSWATVISLAPIVPKALAMRTPAELEREIAERRKAEESLQESETRFRGTFESAAVGIAHLDGDGRFLRVNERFCEILGYSRTELHARTFQEITHPEDLTGFLQQFDELMRVESCSFSLERRYIRKNGAIVWGEVTTSLQREVPGTPAYAIAILQDITERKHAEEALRLANARVDLAVRGSNIGIWEIDMPDGALHRGRVDFTNVWELLGYDSPELSSDFDARMTLVHPDDRARLESALQSYMFGDTSELEVEHRAHHKDGSYRWMLTRGVAIRDHSGRPIRLIGSSIDISDHKWAEEALRDSEQRFRGTFENAAVGMAHKDAEGRSLRVNEKYCEIVGYTREELLQKTFLDITHPDDIAAELQQYAPLMRGELPSYTLEKRYIRKDGAVVWIDLTTSLQRDSAGDPAYAIAILQDISDRKRLEREFREAKEAAEAANRAKDEFLANVSHEIRTPMNAILGMTELALDTTLTDDQREYLTTVKAAAENLLGVINDVLDFSKIEAGKLELDSADFLLRTVLGDTLRALAARAHLKGLELVCHIHPDVPNALVGDAGRLRQIFTNLVGNAIKFTDKGEVVIRVEVAAAAEDVCCLRFSIRDTGIGIPPSKQEMIFEAFEQEDTSTTRKYGGTGLGLTIAARLASLMGGKISVESEPGRGSTFGFTARFGRQPSEQERRAGPPAALLHELQVLIVDDNVTNRRILAEWLRGWGMKPTSVGDAMAAMDALWHGTTRGQPFELVLLDAHMPGTDGLAVAVQIRQRAELATTRIIMLTSGVRLEDPARLRELHLDAHLLKPIQQDELLETIDRVMRRGEIDATPARNPEQSPIPVGARLNILVAEDNEFNTRHMERLLVRKGHEVRLAMNGLEALERLGIETKTSTDGRGEPTPASESLSSPRRPSDLFDVLLLDLHMPELDGFQVVRAIREREAVTSGHLPVIALTARSRKEDRESCLAAGMDDYLSKPIRTAELFRAIDRLIVSRTMKQECAGEGRCLLDPAVVLATCGDDAEGLRSLCEDFRIYFPGRLAEVRNALREGDSLRLREAAHKLYGLLSAFSSIAGSLASDLEERAARGELSEASPLVDQLESLAHELVQEVDAVSLEGLQSLASADGDGDHRPAQDATE